MGSIIRPVKRRTFLSQGTVMREEKLQGQSKPDVVPEGPYGLTVMPSSFQGKRIPWDDRNRKWDIDVTKEELQDIVEMSALKYLHGRKKGELIEKANIRDSADPFFTHPEFTLWLEEGSIDSSETNSIEKAILKNFKQRGEVDVPNGKTKYKGVVVEYEFVDENYDRDLRNEETARRFDSIDLIKNSSFTKKSKIAAIMKINVDKDFKEADLNTLLLSIIDVSPDKSETFRTLCKLPKEELELKYLIHKGLSKGVIKRSPTRKQYFFNGDVSVGRTIENVEEFFKKPENSVFIEELQEYVK